MDTKTPQSAEPEEAPEPGIRRLIRNETTTEIPVHLLFRDDDATVPMPVTPVVVGRRLGTGEQPRATGRPPEPPSPVSRPGSVPLTVPGGTEQPGRALSAAVGLLIGGAGAVLALWWAGALPSPLSWLPGHKESGFGAARWAVLVVAGALALFGFGGLAHGKTGRVLVLTYFGRYRGTTRRTGLFWVSPLLRRHRVDVRLRHWRSEPMAAADAHGTPLRTVVIVVWRVKDAARTVFAVRDHELYLRECLEAAVARVLSQRPAGAPPRAADGTGGTSVGSSAAPCGAAAVGEALTRLLSAETEPVGIEVFSVRPVRTEYAPVTATVMTRRGISDLDARHREAVLTSVLDSVEDTVTRLTERGLADFDEHERKALVRDLTVAFCTGLGAAGS